MKVLVFYICEDKMNYFIDKAGTIRQEFGEKYNRSPTSIHTKKNIEFQILLFSQMLKILKNKENLDEYFHNLEGCQKHFLFFKKHRRKTMINLNKT